MLEVLDLEKSFPDSFLGRKKVLKGISFSISPNKITGFLGPNGAGKTTTIKIIMGLIKADRGKIKFYGEEINKDLRGKIGYLPENPSFYPYLKVREFLYIIGSIEGLTKEVISKMIEEIAEKFLFKEFLERRINTLSKGTLQKVAFSQALIGEPELIILDEPFSGLDPIVMDEIRTYILNLKERKKSILISSHMLFEMERICDDVVLINSGRTILSGNIAKLKEKWRIIKGVEKNEKLRELLKNKGKKDFLEEIMKDEDKVLEIKRNFEFLEEEVPKTLIPTLEEIFLESVKENHKQKLSF